tara:strand:+ start:78 stop:1349 length:1272 start_codon:yes stop_codon:yes gene_type:complete
MIYDSVIQNDNTNNSRFEANITNNYFTWWHIVKQQTNYDPYGLLSGREMQPKPTEQTAEVDEAQLKENERNFYRQYVQSGNTDYSLLNEEQRKKFRTAQDKVREKKPNAPDNEKYRQLVLNEFNAIGQQEQPKPSLKRRAVGAGVKGAIGAGKLGAKGVAGAYRGATGAKDKLSQGVKNILSRTGQAVQRGVDARTARRVKDIDAKSANVKNIGLEEINNVLSSNVFGRNLNEKGKTEALEGISNSIRMNPEYRGTTREERTVSIDELPFSDKEKKQVSKVFGNTISRDEELALSQLRRLLTNSEYRVKQRRDNLKRKDKSKVGETKGREVGRTSKEEREKEAKKRREESKARDKAKRKEIPTKSRPLVQSTARERENRAIAEQERRLAQEERERERREAEERRRNRLRPNTTPRQSPTFTIG